MTKKFLPDKFYAILDYNYIEKDKFYSVANNYLLSGVKLIEVKILKNDEKLMEEIILKIKELKSIFDFSLIMYENPEIVKKFELDGIHLDRLNVSIKEIREYLGNCIIGKACYSYNEASSFINEGVDFLLMGPLFKSKSEEYMGHYNYVSLNELKRSVNDFNLPIVAFGGINLSNIISVIDTGVKAVTVVSDIFQDASPMEKVKSVINLFNKEYRKKNILLINFSDKITKRFHAYLKKSFSGFFKCDILNIDKINTSEGKTYDLVFYCIGKENIENIISFEEICKETNTNRNKLVVLTDMDSHAFRNKIKDYKALALLDIEDKRQFSILNLIMESIIKK